MRLKVLITTNLPAPYFVNYAAELNKYVDLTVVFEIKRAKGRDKKWKSSNYTFKHIFLNAIRIGNESGLSFKIKKIIKQGHFDRIIIANPTTLTGIVAILYCKRNKIPYILQSEGGFQGKGNGLKERFKKILFKDAVMYLTGMGGDDDYFLKYGASAEKLKPYFFTSSYKKDIDEKCLTLEQKTILREKIGLTYQKVILYVGQFIYRKGIDILLEAFGKINNPNYCLVIIGGKPTQEYLDMISLNSIKNVFFIDFLDKDTLANYYRASDIFAMATRKDTWGLVVNEAMEHGLPVVTTNNCVAAKYLIKDGFNGFVINNKSTEFATIFEKILKDDKLLKLLSENSLNNIKEHTIENMALTVYKYLKEDYLT